MTNPADLYERSREALGQLRDLRRTVAALSREYADLEPNELAVDNLGEALTAGGRPWPRSWKASPPLTGQSTTSRTPSTDLSSTPAGSFGRSNPDLRVDFVPGG